MSSSSHHHARPKGSGVGCIHKAQIGTPVLGGKGWLQQLYPNTCSRFLAPHPAFSGGHKHFPWTPDQRQWTQGRSPAPGCSAQMSTLSLGKGNQAPPMLVAPVHEWRVGRGRTCPRDTLEPEQPLLSGDRVCRQPGDAAPSRSRCRPCGAQARAQGTADAAGNAHPMLFLGRVKFIEEI